MKITKTNFSLIELMTVILVILILIALLLPLTNRIRMNSAKTKCANNLNQIAQLFTLYIQDHKFRLPGRSRFDIYNGKQSAYQTGNWNGHLAAYIYSPLKGNWNMRTDDRNLEFREEANNIYEDPYGYNNLSVFLCPTSVSHGRFRGSYFWSIPSTYIALSSMFQTEYGDPRNTKPGLYTDIKRKESKVLLVEGDAFSGDRARSPYRAPNYLLPLYGYSKSYSNFIQYKKAYLHDDIEEFWHYNEYIDSTPSGRAKRDRINDYHKRINVCASYISSRLYIISQIPPTDTGYTHYGKDYQFMTGNMNLLYADWHVSLKDDFWIDENWRNFSYPE